MLLCPYYAPIVLRLCPDYAPTMLLLCSYYAPTVMGFFKNYFFYCFLQSGFFCSGWFCLPAVFSCALVFLLCLRFSCLAWLFSFEAVFFSLFVCFFFVVFFLSEKCFYAKRYFFLRLAVPPPLEIGAGVGLSSAWRVRCFSLVFRWAQAPF